MTTAAPPLADPATGPGLGLGLGLHRPALDEVIAAGRNAEFIDLLTSIASGAPLPVLERPRRGALSGERLRVVYLVPITGPGGGARVLFEHVNELCASGDEVTVVSHFPPPDWMECRARFVEVPLGQPLHTAIPDCDVVVAGFWDLVLPARLSGIAPVVHFEQGPHHLFERLDRRTLVAVAASVRAADATMAVGVGGAEALAERYGVAARLVANAVDCTRFSPPDERAGRSAVLFVGPDGSPFKGIDLARTIAASLQESHPEIEVVWVTPRPPVEGAFGRVVVNPSQDELAQLYRDARIYICTSRFETWGLPALEAMASGTPVVSAANGGIVTFARDGENALLGPVGDAEALLGLARRVLDDPDLARRLAAAGLATARATTWTEVMRDVRSFFVETLAEMAASPTPRDPAASDDASAAAFEGPASGDGACETGACETGAGGGPRSSERAEARGRAVSRARSRRPAGTGLEVHLRHLDLGGDDAAQLLVARIRSFRTSELAIPVSRPVRGVLRRVSWEVVARHPGRSAGVSRFYLPARCEQPPELPEELFGLVELSRGNHVAALSSLLPELQQASPPAFPSLARWTAVALLGAGLAPQALEIANLASRSYPDVPDFLVLAFLAATSSGVTTDYEPVMRAVRLLGNGSRHDEWFDNPIEVMRAHLQGGLGLT